MEKKDSGVKPLLQKTAEGTREIGSVGWTGSEILREVDGKLFDSGVDVFLKSLDHRAD